MNSEMVSSRKIGEISIFSPAECARILMTVESHSDHWTPRGPRLGPAHFFYTLGAATYLDCPVSQGQYKALAAKTNPVLSDAFGWVYARIEQMLASVFGPCQTTGELARPGFHIFSNMSHQGLDQSTIPLIQKMSPSSHCDLQHLEHREYWSGFGEADLVNALSFTIPLVLPATGGGLRLLEPLERIHVDGLERMTLERHGNSETHAIYSIGTACYHLGLIRHQILLREGDAAVGAKRITLQGHGIRCDGVWQLYF